MGLIIPAIEKQVDYTVKVIEKMQRERIKTIVAKEKAVDDFDKYLDVRF